MAFLNSYVTAVSPTDRGQILRLHLTRSNQAEATFVVLPSELRTDFYRSLNVSGILANEQCLLLVLEEGTSVGKTGDPFSVGVVSTPEP